MSTISAFSGAWDFGSTTGPSGLEVTVWYNVSLPTPQQPPNYRIVALLNAAVRGWARHVGLTTSGSTPASAGGAAPDVTAPLGVELLGLMSFPKATNALTFNL